MLKQTKVQNSLCSIETVCLHTYEKKPQAEDLALLFSSTNLMTAWDWSGRRSMLAVQPIQEDQWNSGTICQAFHMELEESLFDSVQYITCMSIEINACVQQALQNRKLGLNQNLLLLLLPIMDLSSLPHHKTRSSLHSRIA